MGRMSFLRDVARIVDTVEERAQETYNNGVQGAMIVVQKQSGSQFGRNLQESGRRAAEASKEPAERREDWCHCRYLRTTF